MGYIKITMFENILYVFDETSNIDRFSSYLVGHSHKKIILCPLTTDFNFIRTHIQKIESKMECEIQLINFVECYNEKAFSIKNDYIDFIGDFPNKIINNTENLKEYFKCPHKEFSLWWFSLVSEKNTLKSESYHKLTKFLSIIDVQRDYSCSQVWIDINDDDLAHTIEEYILNTDYNFVQLRTYKKKLIAFQLGSMILHSFLHFSYFAFKTIYIKIKMRGLLFRDKKLMDSKFLLVTYFPLIDKSALRHNKFINKYYEPLQKSLENKYKNKYTWLAMCVDIDGYGWKKGVSIGNTINKWGDNLFFIEEWLGYKDFIISLLQYFYIMAKFLAKRPTISKEFKYQNEKNVWHLFKKDWYQSFCGWTLLQGFLYYRLFNRLFHETSKDAMVIYFSEMHAWEKSLNIAAEENKINKVIGYQHANIPLLLTMYFNSKNELKFGGNIETVPKPNYLACVGTIACNLFKESGWNSDNVFVWGAIRFQRLKKCLEKETPWKSRRNNVVVALSITSNESKEVLAYVHQALSKQRDYKILIKGHPSRPVQPLLNSMNIELDKDIFKIVDTPLSELFPTAKATIVTESSASLESISNMCPIIVPQLVTMVNMNPFSGISDIPFYVNSPHELKHVVDNIMSAKESPLDYSECKAFIEKYFEFLDTDDEYLARLENLRFD